MHPSESELLIEAKDNHLILSSTDMDISIIEKIDSARNELSRDELHQIAKFADDIIVERFIKGGE